MAGGHPRNSRVEWIKEGGFPFALRIRHADLERRPHHQALQLRLHDPVGSSRTGQTKFVAAHPTSI